MYELRDYQIKAVLAGVEFFRKGKNTGAILVLPTGAGKSLVIASIAQALPGKTIILQPSKEILEQNYQKAIDFGFTDIGIFSASMGRKDLGQITFATIGTIITKKDLFDDFSNLIIDECHLVNAKGGMYSDFIKHFGGKVLGLTATAYRLHAQQHMNGDVSVVAKFLTRTRPKLFSQIIHITQVKDLYEQGYLCQVEYETHDDYKHSAIKLNSTGMDFDQKALEAYSQKLGVVGIVEGSIADAGRKHVLVFSSSVQEATKLSQDLKARGTSAVVISAKTPKAEREEILSKFKSGEIKVVTNVGVLTTGFDFPALDCIVLARPTQSVALYYQMVGRGIRTSPGKEVVYVIDACGNVKRFGKIEEFEIVEKKAGMHRLKSDVSFLTGYDFVSNQDLEDRDYEGTKEVEGRANDIVRFGKYTGHHIRKVPTDYLEWCVDNFGKGAWKDKFAGELKRRQNA